MKALWWGTDAQPIHIIAIEDCRHRTAYNAFSLACFSVCAPRCPASPAPPTSPTLRSGSAAAESSPAASPHLFSLAFVRSPRVHLLRVAVPPRQLLRSSLLPAPPNVLGPRRPFTLSAARVSASSNGLVTGPGWRTRLRNGVWRSRRPSRRCRRRFEQSPNSERLG